MSKNTLKNISLIFYENPIARAYLYLLYKKKMNENLLVYLDNKVFFNNFFLKFKYKLIFKNINNYLKSSDILTLINNIENFFKLEKNFLIEMYKFENIYHFKNILFAKHHDINNFNNIDFFNNLNNKDFLNTSNTIYKNIFKSNKNFYHIHPGFLYDLRGADGSLNSINEYNEIGASFYLMNKKIDAGKIIDRYKKKYYKLIFPNFYKFNENQLYQIWFYFFDPALRVSYLKDLIEKNVKLNNYLNLDFNKTNNKYFSFIKNDKLKNLFYEKIFRS